MVRKSGIPLSCTARKMDGMLPLQILSAMQLFCWQAATALPLASRKVALHLKLAAWTLQRDNDTAGVSFADALGADIFAIGERDMHDTAFVRGHGLQRDRATVIADLLRHAQCQGAQVLFAPLAVVLRVYNDTHAMLGAMAHNQTHQQLQCRQCLATPSYQQAQIFVDAVNVQRQRICAAYLHSRLNIHVAQNML